MEPRENLS